MSAYIHNIHSTTINRIYVTIRHSSFLLLHVVIPCELTNSIIFYARFIFFFFFHFVHSFKRKPGWPKQQKNSNNNNNTANQHQLWCDVWDGEADAENDVGNVSALIFQCTNEQSNTNDLRIYYVVDGCISAVFVLLYLSLFFCRCLEKKKQQNIDDQE